MLLLQPANSDSPGKIFGSCSRKQIDVSRSSVLARLSRCGRMFSGKSALREVAKKSVPRQKPSVKFCHLKNVARKNAVNLLNSNAKSVLTSIIVFTFSCWLLGNRLVVEDSAHFCRNLVILVPESGHFKTGAAPQFFSPLQTWLTFKVSVHCQGKCTENA